MYFYDKYVSLCKSIGKTPSAVALELGISKSTVSKWKSGEVKTPHGDTVVALCEYFGVSSDELLGIYQEEQPTQKDELSEYLDMLRTRPECRVLLDTVKGATKAQVEENVRFLEALRKARNVD